MSIDTTEFFRRFEYIYHITTAKNLFLIQQEKTLFSASSLVKKFPPTGVEAAEVLEKVRPASIELSSGEANYTLHDQALSVEANVAFEDNWTMTDFLGCINSHVFFWPGDKKGPIKPGMNYCDMYKGDRPAILRIDGEELENLNRDTEWLYGKHWTGALRNAIGSKSKRGKTTLLPGTRFKGTTSQVMDLASDVPVLLPPSTRYGFLLTNLDVIMWQPLFGKTITLPTAPVAATAPATDAAPAG